MSIEPEPRAWLDLKILVIKRIQPELARDEEFKRLFIDEARITVLSMSHVQVFDIDEYKERVFMTMEYVHGLDLFRLLSKTKALGPFPIHWLSLSLPSSKPFDLHTRKKTSVVDGSILCTATFHLKTFSFPTQEVKLADLGSNAFQAEEVVSHPKAIRLHVS